ncbi:hypothetical protein [Xanthomonas sp. NCPPB 1128]|uniref:hypothetical protein n=1 Tax=Xanthomonas sp. NCPPB 1128 TaxID=1775876 RepID=UPI000B21AC23|nr:hypothetical protein [Xanthomonas sp. NCPPB 1128]
MGWVAVGAAAVTAIGGAYSANQQKNAAKDAANASNAAQTQAWAANNANMQPYLTAGQNALTQIQQLNAGNFDSFKESPDYAWTRDQGIQALDRSAAASGSLYSGGHSADLMDYASGLASQNYGNFYNRLSGLAGMGQSAAGALAGVNTGYANAVGSTNANLALSNGSTDAALTGLLTGIGTNLGSNLLTNYAGGGRASSYGNGSLYGLQATTGAGSNYNFGNNLTNFARAA